MGKLTVTHDFATPNIEIHISPNEGDKVVLRDSGSNHPFISDTVNQIVVKVQGYPKHCYIDLPKYSDLILTPIEGVKVKLIISKSELLYISSPPPKWVFTITIPKGVEVGEDNVTIGDNPPI